jgi:hexosaminidase
MFRACLLAAVLSLTMRSGPAAATPPLSLIPKPASLTMGSGTFTLNGGTVIVTDHDVRAAGMTLAQQLAPGTGFALKVRLPPAPKSNVILIVFDDTLEKLGQEGYRLDVTPDRIVIRCFAPAGAFYAGQTLRQLLPAAVFGSTRADVAWTVPALSIEYAPRFAWRGVMLDSVRHFIPKTDVLKFIDLLAMHKLNTLHWHLTDDQGWRIEIKKYPLLTAVGSKRKESRVGHEDKAQGFDGTPHGGFYTQGDIREVVAYAKARFVTIVPEIEMPGHAQAAIASYPDLGNRDLPSADPRTPVEPGKPAEPVEVGTRWGIYTHVLNPSEATITFLQDVLTEVLTLFPGRFVHIGGDEVKTDEWKASPAAQARMKELGLPNEEALGRYIVRQMDAFLARRGRRLVGWDEVLDEGLAPGATIMAWRGADRAVAAARAGHDVVMTPIDRLYLDRAQTADPQEPLAIGGVTTLETVYGFEPIPRVLSETEAAHVLGVQGELWTEYIATRAQLEHMAFPRTVALAEVGWTARDDRDFAEFRARLAAHEARLTMMDVKFRPTPREAR